ncbi:LytR/AlgR family response regulator transcription factor [Thermophilibacter provencensis]|uniref:LytR/AlgR family response regulator transcription factor n=1 Tax=Thermophilibacter provencensis TaxID=1852386 RepID=UPI00094B7139|nr:LytTR family DNA-binding domain-containing protein [Thermophilibacter provencensis]
MYRALIVEDDPQAAETLRAHLERYAAERGTSFSVEILPSALEFLEGTRPADVVFMDIGLPGVSGMEAAEVMRQTDELTPLIFVTDLAQYAVRGYQVDALDFMVKPVTYEDFALRMGRAMRVMDRNAGGTVSVATDEGLRVIAEKDVVYVEIFRHDLYWHVTGSAQPLHARGTLTRVAEELGAERFCRVSASHLINMGQLALIRPGSIVMSDGTEIVISRRRRREVLETLTRYVGGSL